MLLAPYSKCNSHHLIGALAALVFVCATGLAAPRPAPGQNAFPAAMERVGPISPEQRAELQRSLAKNAAVLEAQSSLVKTVAKLMGPTVVHIEADATPANSLQYGRGKQIEEAGSGVIVQQKDAFYVLTCRHVIRNSVPSGIKLYLGDGRCIYPTRVWEDAETDVAVLMPMTSPRRFTSGPPLLPGLMAASVWRKS